MPNTTQDGRTVTISLTPQEAAETAFVVSYVLDETQASTPETVRLRGVLDVFRNALQSQHIPHGSKGGAL